MTKATIIEDAITYIKSLQDKVESLTQELDKMEAISVKTEKPKTDKIDAAEEMKKCGIQVIYEIPIFCKQLHSITVMSNFAV